MATQYIKYVKQHDFFSNYKGGGHGFFWLRGGYAHDYIINLKSSE